MLERSPRVVLAELHKPNLPVNRTVLGICNFNFLELLSLPPGNFNLSFDAFSPTPLSFS
ncbi:hypothetical protein CDES_00010 [Corynebacterium deserti GIMN1.010]|uniref:Uncharacterized protein n=1 Tax=Corynebacterium deserti GIMN1.010 TaxID=931089 RepID=A0A0M4CV98_9CORY|nr:hypothetical protein CDES_00010 [Corynebacterium deserti GIMN1.010]